MRALLALAVPLAWVGGIAPTTAGKVPILPPEVTAQTSPSWRKGIAPKPLWTTAARAGYKQRLRLVTYGIVRIKQALSIDEHNDGRITGSLVTQRLTGGGKLASEERQNFRATRADLDMLNALATKAKLWEIYPQFWQDNDPEAICLDGMEVELERATPDAYRYSHANAQCTAPREYLAYARAMFRVAGQDVPGWLGTD